MQMASSAGTSDSTTVAISNAEPTAPDVPRELTRAAQGWLVSPWFDALFIANIAWPLIVLMQFGDGFNGRAGLQFWQVYFITTPHRWITLLLVFLDGERFNQRRGTFLSLAVGVAALCLGVRLATGALTCLLAIDYVWNAWHFAAQHHGIYRIYLRRGEPRSAADCTLEKWPMRGFLLYVTLRVATATWSEQAGDEWLQWCDWFIAAIPVWLLVRDLRHAHAGSQGRIVYLASVLLLFVGLLWAVHERRLELVLMLATASALFHAIEYLAIVSWAVRQRHASLQSQLGLLSYLVPRWGITLAVFVLLLGSAGWFMDQGYMEAWLTLNVIAAFLHYAYDGLIWRRQSAS